MKTMSSVPFSAIDHVQLAGPAGSEDVARRFYVDLLGMQEIPKPPLLAQRGGVWFASGDVQIHIGLRRIFALRERPIPRYVATITTARFARFDPLA